MKIVIDARMYGLENAGIGRYIMNLVHEIKNHLLCKQKSKIKNVQFILLVKKDHFLEISQEFKGLFKVVVCDAAHYSLKEQILLPIQLFKLKPDLVHFPHFNTPLFYFGKFIVTIHDLIKHSSLGSETTTKEPWLYWIKYLGYKIVFRKTATKALRILVPSQTVKNELIAAYHLSPDKIIVTYEGVDPKFQFSSTKFQNPQKILNKYHINKPFLVYTGSVYPHKNIDRLIQAVKLLNGEYNLIISCARNTFYERLQKKIKESGTENYVHLVGFVPDEEVISFYQEAKAFVFPTLAEGFGLPGLEAMSVGCPVICSNIPVLKEIYGEAAIYFDPYDINDMAKKIAETGSWKQEARNRQIEKGFKRVKKYSWEKMTKQTLDVYDQTF